ncbi:MAG: hypothetical protein BWX59_02489 [Bacteroidetes bacterium ADurb.Bin028]|nr:MAG: hypothetical protein BWX59_02489 [Bacteroidetes bacterium ADurb.Bin028]
MYHINLHVLYHLNYNYKDLLFVYLILYLCYNHLYLHILLPLFLNYNFLIY